MLEQLFNFNFLNKAATFSIPEILVALGISFILGLFIFMVYQKTYVGVMYSSSFGITLIGMDMITTLVILAVSSNLITSLGMVGALSIVRFRTAIKDPRDTGYIFWCIAIGISVGSGNYMISIVGSLFLFVVWHI